MHFNTIFFILRTMSIQSHGGALLKIFFLLITSPHYVRKQSENRKNCNNKYNVWISTFSSLVPATFGVYLFF